MQNLDENTEWQAAFPHLAKHADTNPYQVPNGYFENLADEINSKITLQQLQNRVKTDGFTVPENYFDQLNQAILAKTSHPKPILIKLWQNNVFKYASVACVLLMVVSGIFYTSQRNQTAKAPTADLATETFLYDIDESVIRENVLENNASTTTDKTELENYILNNLSSRDIINNL